MKNKIKIKDGRSRRPLNFKKEEEFGFKEKKKGKIKFHQWKLNFLKKKNYCYKIY